MPKRVISDTTTAFWKPNDLALASVILYGYQKSLGSNLTAAYTCKFKILPSAFSSTRRVFTFAS